MNSSKMGLNEEDTTIKTFRIKSKYVKMLEKEALKEGTTVSGVLDVVLNKWNRPQKTKIPYFH